MTGFYLNKEKETDSVVIFLHIPKTGGTTLQHIILEQYSIWRNCLLDVLTIEEQKKIELVKFHMLFGYHKKLPQKKFTYITLLRNPIERLISESYFFRRMNSSPKIGDLSALYEYVTDEKYNCFKLPYIATVNLQTRLIAGKVEDDLETAKNNLKKYFSVVGITERYDESLYVMEKKLGWKINNYKKINVTPDRPTIEEIPKEVIEIIKTKNEKDIELYTFANKLLDEQLLQLKS